VCVCVVFSKVNFGARIVIETVVIVVEQQPEGQVLRKVQRSVEKGTDCMCVCMEMRDGKQQSEQACALVKGTESNPLLTRARTQG